AQTRSASKHNRLTAQRSVDDAKTKWELAQVSHQIGRIVDAIAEGLLHESMKAKMDSLEARKRDLEANLAEAEPLAPVMLHRNLSEVYRNKVANLTEALNDPETRAEATTIIWSLLESIRLVPNAEGGMNIELVGALAGLLSLGVSQNEQSHPEVACCSTLLVAGAGF
ncbi:MAG: recombinase family protein, partial [Shimia sp.]